MINIRDKLERKRRFQDVFSTTNGRYVLMHVLRAGHVFESTFIRGDVNETLLREGERRMALSILKQVAKDDDDALKMMQELHENTV